MHLHVGISEPVYLIHLFGVVLVGIIQRVHCPWNWCFQRGLRSSGIYVFISRLIFAGCVRGCHLNQVYMFADCCVECCIHACASVHVYTCLAVCTGELTKTSLVN